MSIEDRISGSLRRNLGTLDGTPGDLEAVHRSGDRMRSRRRIVVGGLAAVVVALATTGVLAFRGDEPTNVDPAPAGGSWEPVPDLPLAPRADPITAWTGSEVLVVGGYTWVCPPNADCREPNETARDGAAYDPETATWRKISDAPVPMADYFRTAMVADTFVVLDGESGDWFAYDIDDDEWRTIPGPRPGAVDMGSLTSSSDGFVYTFTRDGSVWALNVAEERWAQLPAGVGTGITPRTVVVTDAGFVVSGVRDDGASDTIVADVWGYDDPTVQTGQLNPFRHWTGVRLVELDLQVRENDDGTTTPYGGRLNPATGRWSPLPNQPAESASDGWSLVAADGPLLAGWGYVYDDRDGSWTRHGRPDGAVARDGASAVLADGRLLVVGGADDRSEPTGQAWIWSP
jgi:hypothetical protein